MTSPRIVLLNTFQTELFTHDITDGVGGFNPGAYEVDSYSLTFDLYDDQDQAWEWALFSQPGDLLSNTFYSLGGTESASWTWSGHLAARATGQPHSGVLFAAWRLLSRQLDADREWSLSTGTGHARPVRRCVAGLRSDSPQASLWLIRSIRLLAKKKWRPSGRHFFCLFRCLIFGGSIS